jgi:DNA-binding NarL/FixJ family response regulator
MAVNILLADDHRMVREGLKQLLETDSEINVVAEAGDGYECLNLTNKTKPDIVLLDINMPNMDGIQVLNIMKQQKMLCKVIVLTIHNEIEYLVKALEIGCDGFILKDSDFDTLKKAIFSVYSGETYIEPSLMPLLNSSLAERDVLKEKVSDLTRREMEVLKMIASGAFNKEIALTLNISERTGIWTYMGSGIFRISSLGGEPKGFAQSLIIGFFIIHIFNKMNISFFKFDLLLKIIIVITIFMTLSTSGFVLFFILFFIYYIYLFFLGEVKIKLNLKKTIILIGIMFSAVYLVNTNINFFSSVLNERVLDRNIASEDYDQPIQDFLMAKSEYSIFGVGMGNIHNLSEKYINSQNKFYMANTIFVAKSGYLKLISELGFIGLFLFFLMNFYILRNLIYLYKKNNNLKNNEIYLILSILLILSFVGFLARVYLINIYMIILAISSISLQLNRIK